MNSAQSFKGRAVAFTWVPVMRRARLILTLKCKSTAVYVTTIQLNSLPSLIYLVSDEGIITCIILFWLQYTFLPLDAAKSFTLGL